MTNNFDIKDFTLGTAVKVKSTDNVGVHTPHQIVDSVGGTVTVDGSAVTQPVSGTVTANAGTGTMTISGTVTANLSAVDNAVLDAIEADTTTIAGAVAGTEMQVDIVTSALPTGAATAAKQPALGTAGVASTNVITVQGIAAMTALTVDGSGVTQPISGTVTANAGTGTMAVSGPLTDTQLRATPVPVSGTVTANAGTNLNTSALALETGGNLAAVAGAIVTVDSIAGAIDTGVAPLAVRDDALTTLTPIDGDYAPLRVGDKGALWVQATDSSGAAVDPISPGTAGTPATDVVTVQGIASMTALVVDGSAVTQPVSGTVTANAGTGTMTVDGSGVTQPVSGTAINAQSYETVAASAANQALGATGATGDYLAHVLIVPATTSPGAVSIKDGAGAAITIFTGGASSVGSLVPFAVPINAVSGAGAWQVTTGANVSAIGVGTFT